MRIRIPPDAHVGIIYSSILLIYKYSMDEDYL